MLRLLNCFTKLSSSSSSKLTPKLASQIIIQIDEPFHNRRNHLSTRNVSGFVHQKGPLYISEEVYDRIQLRLPIVALESTIITHGMAYPHNLETACKVESIIRENGSVPATIAIVEGNILVGLRPEQLEQLALKASKSGQIYKVSRSDLPIVCQLKADGGTTVSATSYLANLAGIRTFVTGGIGGVHRDVQTTMDISADLMELGQTPITVVSAGIKSILDIGKSLEVLETNGVCVTVFNGEELNGQVKFPAFFTADSGHLVNYNVKSAESVARIMNNRDELKLNAGILVAVPNFGQEGQEYNRKLEQALKVASEEMSKQNIRGKKVTPYLLSRISELTGGESLKLNQHLIENNAKVGAKISVEFSRIVRRKSSSDNPNSSNSKNLFQSHPVGTCCNHGNKDNNNKVMQDNSDNLSLSSSEFYPVRCTIQSKSNLQIDYEQKEYVLQYLTAGLVNQANDSELLMEKKNIVIITIITTQWVTMIITIYQTDIISRRFLPT